MIAIDTNLIVRFIMRDDEAQFVKSRTVFAGDDPLFIPTTVMLEAEWVFRSRYKLTVDERSKALGGVAVLPNVLFEHPDRIAGALAAMEAGMDFADALHRASSDVCREIVTFDRDFADFGPAFVGVPVRRL